MTSPARLIALAVAACLVVVVSACAPSPSVPQEMRSPEETRSPQPGFYWDCEEVGARPDIPGDETCLELPTDAMLVWMEDPCYYVPPEEGSLSDGDCRAYFGGKLPPMVAP